MKRHPDSSKYSTSNACTTSNSLKKFDVKKKSVHMHNQAVKNNFPSNLQKIIQGNDKI